MTATQDLRQAALLDIEAEMDHIEFEVGAGRRSAASTFTKMRELVNAALVHPSAAISEGVSGSDVPARPTSPAGWALVPLEPTTAMVAAYLAANTAYWERADAQPSLVKWRAGTPFAATIESYKAMLAASPPLPQELGADARDAARYRWLRDRPDDGERQGIALCFISPDADGIGSLLPAECDRRIDAAMSPVDDPRQAQMGETK